MKKRSLAGLILILCLLTCGCATILSYYGLNQVESKVSATTTSTYIGPSTTIAPGSNTISGTISGIQFGTLFVIASTSNTFSGNPITGETYNIGTNESNKSYTINGLSNGTYYVAGILLLNRWTATFSSPEVGSKVGQYSNGYVPASLHQSQSADPDPVTISGSNQTSKDFQLKITWQ